VRKEASELPPELVREVQGYKAIAPTSIARTRGSRLGRTLEGPLHALRQFRALRGLIVDRSAFELNPATKKVTVWASILTTGLPRMTCAASRTG